MRIAWQELAVDLTGQSSDELLSEWRWLVPVTHELRMMSTLGDALAAENFSPCGLVAHFDALAKIQRQVVGLPIGTKISSVQLER